MNPWRTILRAARRSLALLALGIGLALALGIGSGHFKDRLQQELQQQRQQIASLRNQMLEQQQDIRYLDAHSRAFHTLQQRGLLEAPRRESLVEQLVATQQSLNLPDTLTYSMPPPRPMVTPATDPATGQPASDAPPSADTPLMHDIEIGLRDIHEGDLLALLSNFRQASDHRFRVHQCLLDNPTPSGFSATCTLRAFTLPLPLPSLPPAAP